MRCSASSPILPHGLLNCCRTSGKLSKWPPANPQKKFPPPDKWHLDSSDGYELTRQFADIVKQVHIDDKTLAVVKQALLDSHKDELEFHTKRLDVLTAQKTKLEKRIHQIYVDKIDGKVTEEFFQIYVDKIDGKVTEEFFDNTTDKWQEELNEIKSATAKHAKLLQYLLSNCTLIDGTLTPTYRKPFDLMAKGLSCQLWGRWRDNVRTCLIAQAQC